MCLRGHSLEIVEDDEKPTRTNSSDYIMRSAYLEDVKTLMAEFTGRELPGTFNPMVIADLFSRQCKPWKSITENMAEEVHQAASKTFNKMLSEICDENTRTRLMKYHIQPALHILRQDLRNKLDELLEPHLAIHPITYNNDLIEKVQNIQRDRHNRAFDTLSEQASKYTAQTAPKAPTAFYLGPILQALKTGTTPNVEEYSISLAADVAAAYYKVNPTSSYCFT
jgi:hypothetical protein